MKYKGLIIVLSVVGIILLIPLIAMQFTDEVDWNIFDFIVMGILLTGTGLVCDVTIRKVNDLSLKLVICGCVLLALFLIWAELAVGILGTPFAGS